MPVQVRLRAPLLHDLRHSHAAALLSGGHGLEHVQQRLGHESIKTTSDTYGHLLEQSREAALATIDAALGIAAGAVEAEIPEGVPVKDPGRSLYVAHLGPRVLGFWDVDHAEEAAHSSAEWRPAPAAEAEARAWGPDPDAVRVAYATARANALRVCSLNPAARSMEDGQQTRT
ncbi:tyrosine-type recombinase/integrase [Streptomyces turgidiscabies]|uniref:tyrosine-type recombinase/integrase n=1 Tax=Streptomyces turgidiscabies TaxID=85558 RepID=UPI0027D8E477|nr:tyrosine-type recombinase/integrase [Streptomyces turgidiscabies]